MYPPRRPKKLQDISHLFLSTAASTPPGAGAGALVLLACHEDGPWRAFVAAGLARALEAAGMDVTLLEAGRSLPNAGYYFGLEPSVYLHPVLEPGAYVSARVGTGLHFFWAPHPARLPAQPPAAAMTGRPPIVLYGFDRSAGGADGSIPPPACELAAGAGNGPGDGPDLAETGGNGGGKTRRPWPRALVSAGPDHESGYLGAVRRRFSERFPGAPVLTLAGDAEGGACGSAGGAAGEGAGGQAHGGGSGNPERLLGAGVARRAPPPAHVFCGLANELLQQLALRGDAWR